MIHFKYGNELTGYPVIKSQMFRDRAKQFATRLGWDVHVDEQGEERDEYDALNPLYIIATTPTGRHEGSMRLLPTTGPTMVNDHFSHITNNNLISSPSIWECTRFCLGLDADRKTVPKLLAAGAKIMDEFHLDHLVGVFDGVMEKVYRRVEVSPTVIGRQMTQEGDVGVGLWEFSEAKYLKLLKKAGISMQDMELRFGRCLGSCPIDFRRVA